MRAIRKFVRILILVLLGTSVFVPIFLLSHRLKHINYDAQDFVEDLSIIKHRTEAQSLSIIEQEETEHLKEPFLSVYRNDSSISKVSFSSNENRTYGEFRIAVDDADSNENNATRYYTKEGGEKREQNDRSLVTETKEESLEDKIHQDKDLLSVQRKALDEKVKEMRDQVVRAKAYLNFTPVNSTSHFVKELKLRIKDVQRAMSQSTKDSRLSRSSLQKMKAMDTTLLKASRIYPDCTAMVKKLRSMTSNAEDMVRSHRAQETFLKELGGRTIPKGLHCLSMRLTAEYYALKPENREFPNKHKLQNRDLYHISVFSDNILACSVVVNSTVSSSKEPEKFVFHIVTDFLNFPSMSMWFLSNPPGKATVYVESIDNFQWLSTKYNVTLRKEESVDPRYVSELNYFRFYLPDVFPRLNKIVLLDHDVVVQRDLTELWNIKMRGKVNGAVHTCKEGEPSFRRMDMFINFTDPTVAKRFDANMCTWAFGMNLFDLREWRRQSLTKVYLNNIQLNRKRPLWKAGSLPIGWITFYKQTIPLNKRWLLLGLGYDSGVMREDIEQAAVIHFDGNLKPWSDMGLEKYKHFWSKHVKYEHPYLQRCNIHE